GPAQYSLPSNAAHVAYTMNAERARKTASGVIHQASRRRVCPKPRGFSTESDEAIERSVCISACSAEAISVRGVRLSIEWGLQREPGGSGAVRPLSGRRRF